VAKRRKNGVNKAQAIRDYLATNPTAKGTEVVAALKAKGINVAPAQVSNVKTAGKKKGRKKTRRAKLGSRLVATASNFADNSLSVVDAACTMLDHLTADAAKSLIDRLSSRKPR
jgi:hypothetical protein